ncbi:MAG TPA: hypothetical protein VGE40_01390 [Bacilli bacterium]
MINTLHHDMYEQFGMAATEQERLDFQKRTYAEGYYTFYSLIKGFQSKLRTFTDEEIVDVELLIAKAKAMFPKPIEFSLSFQYIWKELEEIHAFKSHILRSIPPEDRSGEWQIIMDNPNTNQEVVCYPGLTFPQAAYLYGYFRPQLEKTEYIRIQKIQSVIKDYGS